MNQYELLAFVIMPLLIVVLGWGFGMLTLRLNRRDAERERSR